MRDKNKTKAELLIEVAELRRQKSLLEADNRLLLDQMPAYTYRAALDETRTALDLDPRLLEILGYSLQDWRSNPDIWHVCLFHEDCQRVLREVAAVCTGQEYFCSEYRLKGKNGQIHWFRDLARVTQDWQGRPRCLQGVMLEFTEQKKAEEAFFNQILFLQTLIDTIPSPIFYKDAAGMYMGCNQAFEDFLGLPQEKIINKTVYDVAPVDLARRYEAMDNELFQNPGIQIYESSVRFSDGTRHEVIFSKATFNNKDGILAGLVGVMLDVTEIRRAEEALKKAHSELEKRVEARTAALAQANKELKKEVEQRACAEAALLESNEKLKNFAFSIVHDLKSPTVGIYGLALNLEKRYRQILDEKGLQFIQQILQASEHVAELVEKINTYIATKSEALNIQWINIGEILTIVREEFASQLSIRQISWIAPDRSVEVRADRIAMLRVFRNVVDNALKYGGQSLSRLEIGYKKNSDHHIFSVTDNGAGLQEQDQEKLFGLFQRIESGGDVHGAGLGLAIVREIAERHGGRVWAECSQEQGTIIHMAIAQNL